MQQRPQWVPRRQQRYDDRPRTPRTPQQYVRPPVAPTKYIGPEVKIFCGHWIPEAVFTQGCVAHRLLCPKCGMEWKGWQVITNRKSQGKKDLAEAAREKREKDSFL